MLKPFGAIVLHLDVLYTEYNVRCSVCGACDFIFKYRTTPIYRRMQRLNSN